MRLALLALVLVAGCASAPSPEGPLAERWRDELANPAPVTSAVLREKHVVFVGGFLNELIGGYFTDNERVTREELGATTTLLFPSSGSALPDDAALIHDAIVKTFAQEHRPLVLVGHSKGGAGVVLVALRYPELVLEGKVEAVISLQGALQGSPVADSVAFTSPASVMPLRLRGLESLTTRESHAAFDEALRALEATRTHAEIERLFARIFYVRSYETRLLSIAGELQATHAFLTRYGSGLNDGLLLQEDMKLDRGVDLGVVPGDHGALTVTGPLSTTSRAEREAFTRALYREVYSRLSR